MTSRLALFIASLSLVACSGRDAATPDRAAPLESGTAASSSASASPVASAVATSSVPASPVASAVATSSAPSEPPPPSASAPPSTPASASPPNSGALPRAFASLGQPCRAGAPVSELCGIDTHIAGITVMVDHVPRVPPGAAQMIHDRSHNQGPNQRELKIAIDGQRLWIRAVTCGGCRRIQGWAFLGDLLRLSDEQLSSVQQRVGLPASEKALRTAAEWRRALAASPPG